MQQPISNQYPICKIHPTQFLQLVCLTCDHNCLACPLCVDSEHQMHKIISLKKFISNEICKIYAKKDGTTEQPNKQNILFYVQKLNSSYQSSIEHMRKQIGQQINQLEMFFKQKGQKMINQLEFICGNHRVPQLNVCIEAVKDKIKNQCRLPLNNKIEQQIKDLGERMGTAIDLAVTQIRRIIFSIKKLYKQSSNILLNYGNSSKFHFSDKDKHNSLSIFGQNSNILINKHFDNSYHTCPILPSLSPFNSEIRFKILKTQNSCIWVGISDWQSLIKSKFINTYKTQGSNYWLWQAGGDESAQYYSGHQIFNQTKPTIGWNFQIGDIISIKIKYENNGTKKVIFSKNLHKFGEQAQSYTQWIDQKIGFYYACVCMGEEGESIQIIKE